MALRFQAGAILTKRNVAITQAVEAVLQAPIGQRSNRGPQPFVALTREYDCEAEVRKVLHNVAQQLLEHRITFSDYLHEPWLLRKIALRKAVTDFYDVVSEYLHVVPGEGVGQLLLLNMDHALSTYLAQHHEGMIRSA